MDNCGSTTHPVASKRPSELGIYDMSGNVWEWCSDWYDSDYYSSSPRNNPKGPRDTRSGRVVRGGGWLRGRNAVIFENYKGQISDLLNACRMGF